MATKIFIDPGHGGNDAGAGGNGLQEKDVTLKIALETRRILVEEYEGVTVKMSREKDATVSLNQRTMQRITGMPPFFSPFISMPEGARDLSPIGMSRMAPPPP